MHVVVVGVGVLVVVLQGQHEVDEGVRGDLERPQEVAVLRKKEGNEDEELLEHRKVLFLRD